MMTHHEHVEVLIDRVHREGSRRVGARRKHVRLPANANDIRCVSASGAFTVERMNRPSFECADRILDESGLVQSVCVYSDLDVEFVSDAETTIDGSGSGSPVFV